jgi:hypothetical protein
MASAAQIAANRLHAQKGAGPRGQGGDAAARVCGIPPRSSAAPRPDRLRADPVTNRILGKQSRFIE